MARTKQEVRNFLNSTVGDSVNAKCGIYRGQCVSEIKALLEFLGVPNPYAGRGNAKDVGDTLIRQNIAENGKGWLTVVVNKSMGNINGITYGHIWVDLKSEANFEQNGAKALRVTKNTRPISQGQQFVTLDKWIKKEETIVKPTKSDVGNMFNYAGVSDEKVTAKQYAYYMARDWKVLAQDVAPLIYKRYTDKQKQLNVTAEQLEVANKKIKELQDQAAAGYVPVGDLYVKKPV